jgi:hypothetical protein
MKASGWIALVFVVVAVAVGIWILYAASGGASFVIGGEILPTWAPIPIAIILAVVFGVWFFALRKKE